MSEERRSSRTFTVRLSRVLLERIDQACAGTSRNSWIIAAIEARLQP